MKNQFKQLVEDLRPWVIKISGKTADKAVTDIARSVALALTESDIDFDTYSKAYTADEIFNPDCLMKNVDSLEDYITPKFSEFCKVLFQLRPVGLGTPNAMVGEGELMCLFGSPRVGMSKKKDTGDLTVDDKTVELKAHAFRLFGTVTGKQLQEHAKKVSKKYNLQPNKCSSSRTAFEPWDSAMKKAPHWVAEFDKLGADQSKKYLHELMSAAAKFQLEDFDECFVKGKFDCRKLQNVIIKVFFKQFEKKWDYMTVMGSDKVRCISGDIAQFNKLVDRGQIIVTDNYFRSFQDTKVGLYVELNKKV